MYLYVPVRISDAGGGTVPRWENGVAQASVPHRDSIPTSASSRGHRTGYAEKIEFLSGLMCNSGDGRERRKSGEAERSDVSSCMKLRSLTFSKKLRSYAGYPPADDDALSVGPHFLQKAGFHCLVLGMTRKGRCVRSK